MSDKEVQMFGCTTQELDEWIESRPEWMDINMIVISMLSDSQEIMESNPNLSRQMINRVKYLLDK